MDQKLHGLNKNMKIVLVESQKDMQISVGYIDNPKTKNEMTHPIKLQVGKKGAIYKLNHTEALMIARGLKEVVEKDIIGLMV